MRKVTERVTGYPPLWCSRICAHSLSSLCCEDCSIAKDGRHFKAKPNVKFKDLARPPSSQELDAIPPKFARAVLGIYMAIMFDELKGGNGESQDVF